MKNGDLIEHRLPNRARWRDTDVWGGGALCGRLGCRVIVTKERLEERWPTDAAFRAFAAKLADAVQRALGEGKRVAPKRLGGECCPLGCLDWSNGVPFPHCVFAPVQDQEKWMQFYTGFDDKFQDPSVSSPYYRLGQAYRRRFTPARAS